MTAVGDVQQGTELNGIYRIDEKIAVGGMGEVYRGHNIQTGDPVAIKIVLPEFARDETILALFRKEASVLNHLAHEAIVRYHVFSIDPGINRPYLAMEFVDGESLAARAGRQVLSVEETITLTGLLASGLETAHEAGVIHRDLSPDNIILKKGEVGRAKIIDFGIAKSAQVGGGTLLGGKFAGKYNFVSPEQLGLFGGEVTPKSDIYSLGLVIAAGLRGAPLDMSGSQVEVIEKRREIPDLSSIDPTFQPLITAMLQPEPDNRPARMADIAEWVSALKVAGARPASEQTVVRDKTVTAPSVPPQDIPSSPPATPPTGSLQTPLPSPQATPPPIAQPTPAPSEPIHLGPPDQTDPALAPAGPSAPPEPSAPRAEPRIPVKTSVTKSQPVKPLPITMVKPEKSRGGLFYLLLIAGLIGAGGAGGYYYWNSLQPFEVAGEAESEAGPSLTPSEPEEPREQARLTPRESPVAAEGDSSGGAATPEQPPDTISPPETEGANEVVASRPDPGTQPDTPPGPDVVVNRAASMVQAVEDYNGGQCFYAWATDVGDRSLSIEGFGTTREPFETMDLALQQSFGLEPKIGMRQIVDSQCAVVDFLSDLRPRTKEKPILQLINDWIKSGDSLQGSVSNIGDKVVTIFLIDNEGVVYNLGPHLRRLEDRAEFNIKLVELAPRDPLPQLILTVASASPIDLLKVSDPVLARTYFPAVLKSIQRENADVGAAMKFFKLGG
ncbi:MAG: protein kinase [Pseudomonadota bacterium]